LYPKELLAVTKRFLSPFLRFFALAALVLLCLGLIVPLFLPGTSAQTTGNRIWLQDSRSLPVTYTGAGASAAMSPVSANVVTPQPVAMAQGDFNQDGFTDLAVGFSAGAGSFVAIHRGNIDAFAPQSDASFQAIARSEFPSPFLPEAKTFPVPISPDFIAAGDFTGQGGTDLVVASRGGSTLYVLAGDGKGNFTPGPTISAPGAITALAADRFGSMHSALLVGFSVQRQSYIGVYGNGKSQQGLAPLAAVPLNGPASNILFGDFGDSGPDAAFLAGGQIQILRSSSLQLAPVSLPVSARAFALGSFVYDRNGGSQIALLGADGSVQIAVRNEFDPRVYTVEEFNAIRKAKLNHQPLPSFFPALSFPTNGWKIVESFPAVGSVSTGQAPVFFRTRVSSNGADDVMWLNASNGQMAVISHPDALLGASTFLPGQVSTKPYNGSPMAALPMRVNVDGRPGIMALHQGEMAPSIVLPIPDPTFTVNRNDDPVPASPITNACNGVANDCSLREAVLRANALAGTDTIMLPAGTFTLTRGRIASPAYDAVTGTLNVNDSVNIVGSVDGVGNPTSIITWGALTSGLTVDMVMAVNEDISPITAATASISNVIIENGVNNGTHSNDGDGGCMEFDTGSAGTANLTLTNVTLQNCSTLQGGGAGIVIFNFVVHGAGFATITGSTIQGNSAVDNPSAGPGGGIAINLDARMVMTNSQVLNNKAEQVISGQMGIGGGIVIFTPQNVSGPSAETLIHASTISGNKSAGFGGGIWNGADLLIDQGTIISNNVAGTDGTNPVLGQEGGGLYLNTPTAGNCPSAPPGGPATCTSTLTKVTITGNTATGNGGGISNGSNSASGSMTMSFSRLAGNTVTGLGSLGRNLNNNHATATVTNNWWGTNAPAGTINTSITGATTTSDPFIVLTHTASPPKIRINQSSTLTGDMSKDNHGVGTALAGNLDEIVGLPITFHNPVLGTIPETQPETLGNPVPTAVATYNAGAVGGNGSADATVDQQTVTAPVIVLQPPSITKNFNPTTIATTPPSANASTITFAIVNGNTVAIDSSFTDTLPANLVVATTPAVVNGCGGSVTAAAGSGTISFANAALAVDTPTLTTPCLITVNVQSAVDNTYSNSVTIDSADAGNGNTATANPSLTVINPPSITKAFGAATVPLNGTTSLTFTLTSTNANLTLSGIAFTDSLPAGLVVATPPTLSNICGGTATAAAGSGSVSLSTGTLAPGASCTVSVNVTGTTAGLKNNSVTVSDAVAGTGNTSNASITVVTPPTITKAFGATSIPLNGSTSLSFTINNPNGTVSLTGVAFSDTLPAGLVISTPNGQTGSCGSGTITATAGSNSVTLTGGTIAAGGSCTFSVNVTGIAAGQDTNTTGNVTSTEGGTGNTASAGVTVVAPPSIAKAFNPTSIPLNGTTTLTFTITNPAANTTAENGVAFNDILPAGLTASNGTVGVCGGTLTVSGGNTIALSGASIAVNSQCVIPVTVTGAASGLYTNTSGAVSSTNGGTGNTATANLTVATPPSIAKVFGAIQIPVGGTTSLTFTIQNPNAGLALTGIAFTDNLPAGLVVATPNGLTNTCGGTASATAGGTTITLSGATLAASASCTVSANIQGTTAGLKNNSVQVTSNEGGTSNTSSASLTVTQASTSTGVTSSQNPSVFGQPVTFTATVTDTSAGSTAQPTGSVQFVVDGVNFGPAVALAGASSNSSTATSQATATLSVAGSPHSVTANYINADGNFTNSSGSLAGGQIIAVASTNTVVVSSANPSTFGQSVTFTATVTDISAGSIAQPTGSVQFVVDGVNFGTPVALTGASSNTSTATSQATTTLSIAGSPHSVTANYVNADGNFTGGSAILAGGQVVTAANTTTTVTPSAGTITLGDTVTFTATVTANPPATGTPTGIVTFFDGTTPIGNGKLNALSPDQTTFSTAVLAVGSHSITAIYNGDANFTASPLTAPTTETVNLRGSLITLVLNPTTVGAGQASTETVTVTDGGVSTPPGTPDVFTATGAPATGRTGFTATLFADGAVVVVGGQDANNVVLNTAEVYFGGSFSPTPGNLNTARTGAVAVLLSNGKVLIAGGSSNGSANGALQSAELLDLNSGTFAPTSHNMTAARFGTTTTLLSNGKVLLAGGSNSGGVLNSAELYDPVADTFTATGNLNAARTGASATLLGTGKVLVAGGSSDGTATGALNSAEVFDPAGNAGAGTFTSVAGANPTLATGRWQPEAALLLSGKVLVAGGQDSGGVLISADLYDPVADSFTASASQLNEGRANGSAVSLPSGMVLLAGGTTSQTVELYDGESDQFNLTGSLLHHVNGSVATLLNNGDVLVVGLNSDNPPPFVSDAELYSPTFNPLGTIGFGSSEPTDVFGSACQLAPSTSTASTCTSTVTPAKVATSPHTITATYPADAVHSSSNSTAALTVIPAAPPTIAKAFSSPAVGQNGLVNVSFTIVNPNPSSTLTGISFTDALPAGLVVASPNNLNSNCGGTFTAVPGSSVMSLTGGTVTPATAVPASGLCVITVDLSVTGTGTLNNTTGPISANESGPGNPSNTATVTVVLAPTVIKAFGAVSIPVGGTTSLTFNIANPNGATALIGIALNDTLPAGLVVATPNGLTGTCVASSVIGANPGSNSVSLTSLNLPASGSCSYSVNVTGTSGGTKTNTTAPINALFDDGFGTFRVITGGTASAITVVVAPPAIAKSFSPSNIAPNAISTLTFTITNPAANTAAEAGVAFTDTFPTNVVVATPNGLAGNCNGGTVTAVAGGGTVSLTGGTIPAASSCTVSVNVTSALGGTYTNITGAVSSTNGGTGNTATAVLSVVPDLTIAKTHSGNFTQGDVGDTYTITVSNIGGPTTAPVTVTDAVPAFLFPTALGGTGWTCTLATATCTRSDVLAAASSYPPITLTVSVAVNAPPSVTNSVTVSGGGEVNTANDTATDPTTINQLPGPPLTISLLVPSAQTIKNGNSAQWVFDVVSHSATLGNINFACSNLPPKAACTFNPQTENTGDAQVTMTLTTTPDVGLVWPRGLGNPGPVYAALLFPVLGLVSLAAAGRRGKKNRMRLVMFLGGLLVLMALFGCGGTPHNGTPIGQFPITVTATSAANPTVTATTQVVVTVQ
jgi:uncharacterized repeat protein (TIGR01451 family)